MENFITKEKEIFGRRVYQYKSVFSLEYVSSLFGVVVTEDE